MKLPKLPKKYNRACKLTEKDIENVYVMRSMDLTYQQIANKFGVTKQAIFYILRSDEQKKVINKQRHQRDTNEDRILANKASAMARKYKRKVLKQEMNNAEKINSQEYRKEHPEYNKLSMKKHYYKEKIGGKWYGAIERKSYRLSTTSPN